MSFFPATYDPREDVVALLDLCAIDTADGTFRFMMGTDGTFTDSNGNAWLGSSLARMTDMPTAIGGTAPAGGVTLSYFQDPDAPDLMAQIKALGLDYIRGREIRFYIQPIHDPAEFYAPAVPPILWVTRFMRELSFEVAGAQDRSITVGFESWAEQRSGAARLHLNTVGHAKIAGAPNPSLSLMPTVDFQTEKLFG